MSGREKLLERFLRIPKDLSWEELIKVLAYLGYEEKLKGKTGGSRRKFVHEHHGIILLHKPHPRNIVKTYAIRQVIENLESKGLLKDE